jgi:DNA-binding Xre family transcriptional regulator
MAFNYSKLRGRIRECGLTQAQLAESIGIHEGTLSAKLNNQNYFTTSEIDAICKVLKIARNDIPHYFFAE